MMEKTININNAPSFFLVRHCEESNRDVAI